MNLDLYAGFISIKDRLLESPYSYSLDSWQQLEQRPVFGYLVGSPHLLVGTADLTPFLPGIFIGIGEFVPIVNTQARGKIDPLTKQYAAVTVDQQWIIDIIVPHIRTLEDNEETGEMIAGPIASHIISSLLGFKITDKSAGLRLSGIKAPVYSPGWAEYPLVFTAPGVML